MLFDTGNMACWGDGSRGQVGHGSTSDIGAMPGQMGANLPLVDLGNHTVLDIDAHLYYTCALLDDSSMKCWGNTLNGRTFHHGDEPNEMGANLPKVDLGSQASPQQISSGLWHRCALLKDCSLKCWGMNAWGRLGYGDQVNRVDDDPSRMGDNLPSVELVINTSPHTDCSSVTTSRCLLCRCVKQESDHRKVAHDIRLSYVIKPIKQLRSTTTTATMTTTSTPDLCASPGQCVVYKGYEYRTLDGTFPDSNSAGYQDYWLPLPDGWEIAPWEEDVRAVAEGHPWGAHRIVHSSTTREHCSCTPLYTSCECSWGSGRIYGTRTVDNVTEYKTSHNDRILIRRPSGTTTTSTTALTWQLVVSGHGSTSQVAAATYSDQMVIYGGGSQLWRLDLEAGAWQSIAATGTAPSGSRSYMAGSKRNGELIYFGGRDDASVFRLTASMTWLQVALSEGPRPTNRHRHTAVRLSDGSLLIYAGFTFGRQPLGDVWKLIFTSEAEGFWQEMHTTGGGSGPRLGPAGIEGADGNFLTFAGHEATWINRRVCSVAPTTCHHLPQPSKDWGEFFDDVWRLTINGTTGVWQLVVVSGPTPGVRTFPSAVAVPDGMLIYGGFNDQIGHALKQTAYNDVWHMAINGNTGVWQNLEPAGSKPGAGSHSQASVLCGVGLVVTIGSSTHKLNWPTGCPPGYAWQAGHCLRCPDGFESLGGCNLCQASAEPSTTTTASATATSTSATSTSRLLESAVNVTEPVFLEADANWMAGLHTLASTVAVMPGATLTIQGDPDFPAAQGLGL